MGSLQSSTATEDLSALALNLYTASVQGARVQSSELLRQEKRVSRTLFLVAAVHTPYAIFLTIIAFHSHSALLMPLRVVAISVGFLAALFWLLWIWSKASSLPPAIAGVTMYLTVWAASAFYTLASTQRALGREAAFEAHPLDWTTLARWGIVIALCRAVAAGVKYRNLTKRLECVDPGADLALPLANNEPRRLAGICTGFALFVVLLYQSINLISLWGENKLDAHTFNVVVLVESVLIVVWSIACWRDVYRPLIKPIEPGWYFAAIFLGGVTFTIARCWGMLLRYWGDLPIPDPTSAVQSSDIQFQILLVAVQPAICEELAFRGIIFGGFSRSLKGWENVVVTSLMFMVLHMTLPSFPHLLIAGLVLGILRHKSGSWLPGVMTHFVHNFLTLVVPM